MTAPSRSKTTRWIAVILLLWLAVAVALSVFGVWQRSRIPVPMIVIGLFAAEVLALCLIPRLRAWVLDCDLRLLVAPHLVRFVGILFLVMYRRGELPWRFAVPGGWGDIVIATGAVALLLFVLPLRTPTRRHILFAWNAAGLMDIAFVVSTALRLTLSEPNSMSALTRLPLSLLPTFFVPLIFVSHSLIFLRLNRHPLGEPAGTATS